MTKDRFFKNASNNVIKFNPEEHSVERLKLKKYEECDKNGKVSNAKKTAKKTKK